MASEDEVTVLFEQHTVAQVQQVLAKTRSDIESKKEELRVMVGERYRDLIEAADTIAEMQGSATAVCHNIKTMESLCESLQQRGLIGFKTHQASPTSQAHRSSSSCDSHYSLAVQVKVLVSVPEALWSLTEQHQYLSATQLLLLALHTHTALQLSPHAPKVSKWFPVIERQWASINQFRTTIVGGCSSLVSSEVDDVQGVLDAVVSYMLVEGCGTAQALELVLKLRRSALMAAIQPKPEATAKTQISNFTTLFLSSLNIVYALFIACEEGGVSEVEQRVREVVEGGGAVSLLQEASLTLSFLPSSISNFRPRVKGSTKTLERGHVRQQVEAWLQAVLAEASTTLATLLSFSTSIKALAMIRTSVTDICNTRLDKQHWHKVTEVLCGAPVEPWEWVVRGGVCDRARQVVEAQLSSAKEATLSTVAHMAAIITTDPKVCVEEGDISGFVWGESAGDLPERVGWTPASSRPLSQAGGLYYKTRGYTSRLQTVCRSLNARLMALLQDVEQFNVESDPGDLPPSLASLSIDQDQDTSTARQDYHSLLSYLQDATCSTLTQLAEQLEELAQQHLTSTSPHTAPEAWEGEEGAGSVPPPAVVVVVVVGRLCQALPNVCPHMPVCAAAATLNSQDMSRRLSLGSKIESKSWLKVRQRFTEASSRLLGLFLQSLTATLQTELTTNLTQQASSGVTATISSFPTWETVEIEEEGEGGQVVKSSIQVPAHPSPALTQALTRLCTSLNCVAAHTITRGGQGAVVSGVCEAVTAAYESALTTTDTVNQTLALQLLFDLRFLHTALLLRDNKEVGSRLTAIMHKLEARVDPFDLDVFLPHLSTRVKLAVHRVQVLLGGVLPRDRQGVCARASVGTTAVVSNNNSLPIIQAVEIPRFSNVPLPVSSSSSRHHSSSLHPSASTPVLSALPGHGDKTPHRQTPIKGGAHGGESATASSASLSASRSAASLFSAMSSSWFGSSSS